MDEEALGAMSEKQRRLFKLRMMINKGRKANKSAASEEKKRLEDPYFEAKQKAAARKAKKAAWAQEMSDRGLTTDQSYLFETLEMAHGKYDRKAKKEKGKAAFGWDIFNQDTLHAAYEKRLAHLPKATKADKAESGQASDGMAYGEAGEASKAALDRMAAELAGRAERQKKFSRRRTELDGADGDHINDRNAVFNKKIKRAYDKYTVEIQQNLERGTAL